MRFNVSVYVHFLSCLDIIWNTEYTKFTKSFQDVVVVGFNTGRFIMFSVITNIYNKKTKGLTLMEFFTATGKLKKSFF